MPNWTQVEKELADVLTDTCYAQRLGGKSPAQHAHECVQRAQGSALAAYSGEITVAELKHPARPGFPTRLVRGYDTTRTYSPYGEWWIDYDLFERFRRATTKMPAGLRAQKVKDFMRARSAVSHDWSNMAGIAELELPPDARTPALIGKAHYQKYITDTKHPEHVPNVFLMGGDTQFYVCFRERSWIRDLPLAA